MRTDQSDWAALCDRYKAADHEVQIAQNIVDDCLYQIKNSQISQGEPLQTLLIRLQKARLARNVTDNHISEFLRRHQTVPD